MRVAGQILDPLVINPISDTTVALGDTLSLTVSVTNIGVSANELVWTLQNPPPGAGITNGTDPSTALITWQPSAAQAPSTNTLVVQVQDQFNPSNVASTAFHVTVFTNAVNGPPVLAPIANTNVALGGTLTFTANAHNTDGSANALIFSLDPDAPDGADIDPDTGVFTWTPTLDQAGDSRIGVIVTEDTIDQLTAEQFFTVTVLLTNACPGYADFVAAVTNGGYVPLPDCPTIILSNTLVVTKDVTIDAGANPVLISANNLLRLFTVLAPATLTLNGMTLSGGQSANGGAIWVQAGASAVITDCVFSKNAASGSNGIAGANGPAGGLGTGGNGGGGAFGGPGFGGAIYNAGDVTISTSHFLTNTAAGGNGGNGGNGGSGDTRGGNGGNGGKGGGALGAAIYNLGTISIDSCSFEGNSGLGGNGGTGGASGNASGLVPGMPGIGGVAGAASGAGLYNAGSATVANCTFSANSAEGGNSAAGGTQLNGIGSNGPRGGEGSGGGIFSSGQNAVTNCTFFSNIVIGGNGGDGGPGDRGGDGGSGGNGLGAGLYGASGANWVVNCTFAQNQAKAGTNGIGGSGAFNGADGGPGGAHGAGVLRSAGTFFLQNSILATNAPGGNAYGTITDGGKNISSDSSLSGTSKKNTDAKLGPLADNGGPTETMALLTGSPAIDAGDDNAAPDVDQRGEPRPAGVKTDIGAYELQVFTLSGRIIEGSVGLAHVSVSVGTNTVTTDTNGNYVVSGLLAGTYEVTPALDCYFFNPASRSATVGPSDTNGVNFVAGRLAYTVSGNISSETGGLGNVSVKIGTNQVTTDENGDYSFSGLCAGTYVVKPTLAGFVFDPPTNSIAVGPDDADDVNFDAFAIFSLSGQVRQGASGLVGVTVTAASVTAGTNSVTTSTGGSYSFPALRSETYIVTPSRACYHFSQASIPITLVSNTSGVNFSGTPDAYTISGRSTSGTNALSGVTISAGGKSTVTAANGSYSLTSLCAGTYTVTPSLSGYQFQPSASAATVGPGDTNGVNFQAFAVFNISGQIRSGASGLGGVTVNALGTNGNTSVASTVASGAYALTNLRAGTYILTPALACYRFAPTNKTPVNQTVTVGPSTNGIDFSATHLVFTISGRVVDGAKGLSGVAVQISGPNGSTTVGTLADGTYALSGLCQGVYQVMAALTGYNFGAARAVALLNNSATNVNFVAGQAPSILVPPADQTVALGTNASFSVTAGGTPPLSYQWLFNGTSLAGATDSSLTMLGVTVSNLGSYSVIVTNLYGSTNSAPAVLRAVGAPVIVSQPASLAVAVGTGANFSVTAGGDQPLAYQWQFNGNIIPGAVNTNYLVQQAQTNNSGNYSVVITNSLGSITSAPAALLVGVPPTVATPPSNRAAAIGSTATFSVAADGTQPLVYQWRFNGASIPSATNADYSVSNAQTNNAGLYDVVTTNLFGSITSAPATLAVGLPPTINSDPSSQTVLPGSGATFNVTATGSPPLAYVWRLNLTNIVSVGTNASYSVASAGPANAGTYTVLVTNLFGSVTSAPAALTLGAPPTIVSAPSSQTTGAGCSASFTVLSDGTFPLAYQWRRDSANIPGATDLSYSIESVSAADNAARFDVIITNIFGTATSAPAVLTVDASGYTISGRVLDGATGLSGVTVTATAAGSHSAITDANGDYVIRGLPSGTYSISASKVGYRFNGPISTEIPQCVSGANFSAQYLVSGRVLRGGVGFPGVPIFGKQATDTNGFFSLSLPGGTNVLTPAYAGYSFSPRNREVVTPPDATNQDFVAGWLITSVAHITDGAIRLTVSGYGTLRIEASSDLVNWISVYTHTNLPIANSFTYVDSTTQGVPVRFYRVVQP